MTKKTLNWRLKQLPDAVDVAELVDKKVITPDEARQLLFNEGKEDTNKIKALEEEVKFLRELCDKLAAKSNGWTTVVKEFRDYRPYYPTWYANYGGVISTVSKPTFGTFTSGTTLSGTATGISIQSGNIKALSTLN